MDALTREKYSSAFTLSDMELFIFPELLYALVLANLMSPRIWAWREDPWFRDIHRQGFNRRLQRLKQYIMDHYSFNLDLETWGLTTKPRELARFAEWFDPALLARSNALFGYEGDKYYFDIDIRRHFGLDKYDGDVIPYWKTETVEAMDAFVHKPQHAHGAGECVSLSALYAAALYIVAGIPLEDIFLLATPLHSQNFVAQGEGVLTNNRRLVTKSMWFNGSVLTEKARRALEKERVTTVAHVSGYIHIEYPEATIDPAQYQRLRGALDAYLTTPITFEIFANFLRVHGEYRKHFQFEYLREGRTHYITAESLYHYEHNSRHRIGDASRAMLLEEVEGEDFELAPIPGRYVLNVLERLLNGRPLECSARETYAEFLDWLADMPGKETACRELCGFASMTARLPETDKRYLAAPRLDLPLGLSRAEIIAVLQAQRDRHPVADLAFLAGRRLREQDWPVFLQASLERNPVSLLFFQGQDPAAVYRTLQDWPNESIYAADGMATPDEVVNFGRGDGLEKAVCLANVLRRQDPGHAGRLTSEPPRVRLSWGTRDYVFTSAKTYALALDLESSAG